MFSKNKKYCHDCNLELSKTKLQFQSFGNVSSRINEKFFTIKPSGVNLKRTKYKDYPIISIIDGKIVRGKLKPSVDTPIHQQLYKHFRKIGGIVHTHSHYATVWSQANKSVPVLGTTHADYWLSNVPVTRKLKANEILKKYEENIGKTIIEFFKENKTNPMLCPGILAANHGPFAFGENSKKALLNAERIEYVSLLAFETLLLNSKTKISNSLVKKHYFRKNGQKPYYGQ